MILNNKHKISNNSIFNTMQTDNLCNDFLYTIQKESDTITNQINIFYEENKDNESIKHLLYNNFQEQIEDFRLKYVNTFASITDKTNGFISFYPECDKKFKVIVDNLLNYIENLISI